MLQGRVLYVEQRVRRFRVRVTRLADAARIDDQAVPIQRAGNALDRL